MTVRDERDVVGRWEEVLVDAEHEQVEIEDPANLPLPLTNRLACAYEGGCHE